MRTTKVPGLSLPAAPAPRRPSATQRGYGAAHRRERTRWQQILDSGAVIVCWRCHLPVPPDPAGWDLGHDEHDRSLHRGPEHAKCNRAAAARKGNRRRQSTQLEW